MLDTTATLNAMRPDVIVIRHDASGAVQLIADKVGCAVLNAGDGRHEHPTQALLDALTIRRRKGRIENQRVAICGDVLHSRVARSNILALTALAAEVRVVAPPTLMPAGVERMGVTAFTDMDAGLEGADVVMMLRVQNERMEGAFVPSTREYHALYGLTRERLAKAAPDALVMASRPDESGYRDHQRRCRRSARLGDHRAGRDRRRGAHGLPRRTDARAPRRGGLVSKAPTKLPKAGTVAVRNGRVVDPAAGTITPGDVLMEDGRITLIGRLAPATVARCETIATPRAR